MGGVGKGLQRLRRQRSKPKIPPNLRSVSNIPNLLGKFTHQVSGGGVERQGQLEMAEIVAQTLGSAGEAVAIQAGTGTGKSIAYLTPVVDALAH